MRVAAVATDAKRAHSPTLHKRAFLQRNIVAFDDKLTKGGALADWRTWTSGTANLAAACCGTNDCAPRAQAPQTRSSLLRHEQLQDVVTANS